MNRISVFAPAKLNLFLEVHDLKEDDYHNIQSIMQTVSVGDYLDIEKFPVAYGQKENKIKITCSDSRLPCDESNIIYKAANLFFEKTGIVGNVSIDVIKMIPIATGMAGGSADAAATFIGLNKLFGVGFTVAQMCEMTTQVGADVPFCIKRGTCLAEGVGEKLTRLPDMPDCDIVIGIGSGRVSTRWAYHRIDDIKDRKIQPIENIVEAIEGGDLNGICKNVYNVFETISPYDDEIRVILNENGSLASCLSGSGSAIYGLFDDSKKAKTAFGKLLSNGYRAFICKPIGMRDAGVREPK